MLEKRDDLKKSAVTEYHFQEIASSTPRHGNDREYVFQDLKEYKAQKVKEMAPKLRVERTLAKERSFLIDQIVKDHRGIQGQEEADYAKKLNELVIIEAKRIEQEAYQKGFEEGRKLGFEEIKKELKGGTEEKLILLDSFVESVRQTGNKIVEAQRDEIMVLINRLVKWLALKEIDMDPTYLERVVNKCQQELNAKTSLHLRVSTTKFKEMQELVEDIKFRFSHLKDVKVEIDPLLEDFGLIVETENGLIDSSLSKQFEIFDRLFFDKEST